MNGGTFTPRRYFREERAITLYVTTAEQHGAKVGGEFVVRAYSILLSNEVCFEAYEPVDGHSTQIGSYDHGHLGSVRTRRLPDEISALPYGDERTAACQAYHRGLDALAEELVRAAFPELSVHDLRTTGGQGWADLDVVNDVLRDDVAVPA